MILILRDNNFTEDKKYTEVNLLFSPYNKKRKQVWFREPLNIRSHHQVLPQSFFFARINTFRYYQLTVKAHN